jgi:hypothetical protein
VPGESWAVYSVSLFGETTCDKAHFDRRSAQSMQQQDTDLSAFYFETRVRRHQSPL